MLTSLVPEYHETGRRVQYPVHSTRHILNYMYTQHRRTHNSTQTIWHAHPTNTRDVGAKVDGFKVVRRVVVVHNEVTTLVGLNAVVKEGNGLLRSLLQICLALVRSTSLRVK